MARAFSVALGVREQSGRTLTEVLAEALSGQDLLIVIDNCEHVVGTVSPNWLNGSTEPARGCGSWSPPASRSASTVSAFTVSAPSACHRKTPRSWTSSGPTPSSCSSNAARSHNSTFAVEASTASLVASVCRRLDGIPLALELAAARLSGMSLAHLDGRLDQRFRLLTGGARTSLPRQRTLRATFDWSFELLSRAEQATLARLSVFFGSFELEAAEAVCATAATPGDEVADIVGSLVDKSLVVAQRTSGFLRYLPVGDGPPVRRRAAASIWGRGRVTSSQGCPRRLLFAIC